MAERNSLKSFKTVTVNRAHKFKDGNVSFDATFDNLVTIYGMRKVSYKKGDFIGFPRIKSSDGEYYNQVYCNITDELQEDIFEQLDKLLD